MKILFICADHGIPVFGSKGASVHVRELTEAFYRCGHQVTLVAPTTDDPDPAFNTTMRINADLKHIKLSKNSKHNINLTKQYLQYVGSKEYIASDLKKVFYNQELEQHLHDCFLSAPPDFIYVRASLYSTAGIKLSKALKCPLIVELNAPLAKEQAIYRGCGLPEVAELAERTLLSNASAICCVSEALRTYALSQQNIPDKLYVTPNGVNPLFFAKTVDGSNTKNHWQDGDHPASGPIIGFVGSLRPWHGINIIPALIKKISVQYQDVKFMVVGNSPLNETLLSAFKQLGIESNLAFTGARPHHEIPDLIRQFDIAIAPYSPLEHEFYFSPIKIFEYMACGVPVVAARIGQIRDVIDHKRTGWLYSPDNLDDLVNGCLHILEDSSLARYLGQQAKQLIRDNYTWDHNARRIINIVKDCCDTNEQY